MHLDVPEPKTLSGKNFVYRLFGEFTILTVNFKQKQMIAKFQFVFSVVITLATGHQGTCGQE
jgi:hypothetical protein